LGAPNFREALSIRALLTHLKEAHYADIRIDLNPEIEARLIAEARSQGVPLEKLAERLLKEALSASSLPHGMRIIEKFQLRVPTLGS